METAKYCSKCGEPLPPESKQCPNCGADVPDVAPAQVDDVQQATPKSPYTSEPAAPVSSQATVVPGLERMPVVGRPKRLGGGVIAILGGVVMLVAQGFFMGKGDSLDLLGVGLGVLCLLSGIVTLAVQGWGWVILGTFLSGGVFALCGLKLYQTVLLLQAQTFADATKWTFQSGGIIWIGGMMLGMIAFTKAFQSLFRR